MSETVRTSDWGEAAKATTAMAVPFEQQLTRNLDHAMNEASQLFEGKGKVYETFDRITRKLDELGLEYAVCGGLALFAHGFRRFTEDVDILVTADGLRKLHEKLDGLGFVRPFAQSKNLRDVTTGVRIEFLIAGQFPGDGKPKAIAFPTPAQAAELIDGRRILSLNKLIELKLASGLTGAGREKDFGDVSSLIQRLGLPLAYAESLHPDVREKYQSIWRSANAPIRYVLAWPHGSDPAALSTMLNAGVEADQAKSTAAYQYLITTDAALAQRYQMVPEEEFYYESGSEGPTSNKD
jgi:hypothetical protein